ncbi:MAG: hypothetical protein LBS90_01510 [Oscillospiraceae bacterium]|jgi:hypothetical protein|nr:hypothetical protein [Oscillospiraceae bacterium]
MADTNMDKIIQKAKEIAEIVVGASAELYKSAEEKTKLIAKIAKLKAEIVGEKTAVKKLYASIGKQYYHATVAGESPELTEEVAEVSAALERIEAKTAEIDSLKTQPPADDSGEEPDAVYTTADDDEDDETDTDYSEDDV